MFYELIFSLCLEPIRLINQYFMYNHRKVSHNLTCVWNTEYSNNIRDDNTLIILSGAEMVLNCLLTMPYNRILCGQANHNFVDDNIYSYIILTDHFFRVNIMNDHITQYVRIISTKWTSVFEQYLVKYLLFVRIWNITTRTVNSFYTFQSF